MKMKSLAVMAASGLMAASLAYVVPAFAEDPADEIDGAAPMQLAMADDAGSTDSSSSDISSAAATDTSNASGSATGSASGTPNTSGATSDQPAQGDDDY